MKFSRSLWVMIALALWSYANNAIIFSAPIDDVKRAITDIQRDPADAHDAYLTLQQFPSKAAVPVLIDAIAGLPKALPDGSVICTAIHCIDALEAQTGKNFRFDQNAWKKWWTMEGVNLPESYFDPTKHRKKDNALGDRVPPI